MTRGQFVSFAVSVALLLAICVLAIRSEHEQQFRSWPTPRGDDVEIREETP